MSHEIWIGLDLLQEESHDYSVRQGFWDHDLQVPEPYRHAVDSEKIALMHSELSEALDELRNGNMEGAANELMDCVIRICDYCEQRGLRLNQALNRIRAHREGRPPLHGRQW